MTGPSRDADADVITAGREPRLHHAWTSRLAPLLVIAQTTALIAVIAVALYYRAEVGRPGHGGRSPGRARRCCPR